MHKNTGFQVLTKTETVVNGPCYLDKVVVDVTVDGAFISIYDGQDAGAGKLLTHVHANSGWTLEVNFGSIPLSKGLHIVFDANVQRVLAIYQIDSMLDWSQGYPVKAQVPESVG